MKSIFTVMKSMALVLTVVGILMFAFLVDAAEYHVAVKGNDANSGTKTSPFRTIQHAADVAMPGDIVTVHAGVYRERVTPPRGGTSNSNRITYQAAPGEKVTVTGSEIVKNWERVTNDIWKVTIPDTFFGKFNPYFDLIHGDWFGSNGRWHHSGAVYLNGGWFDEAAKYDQVFQPAGASPLWYGEVTNGATTIWAQFKDVDPNQQTVEINVRQTVFTPQKTGINYLTVRGFDMRNAATPWAPPSAGQFGVISAYWCKGWIIEDNEISYSRCCGVALGKYSDEFDNTNDKGTADPYTDCVRRALKNGWNKETVGSHIVRHNHIHHCEQAGIVGSLGCSFSTISGNDIHDIHVRNLFGGAEMAGIKFHGAIDVVISHNHIYRCGSVAGLWLDWMAQGAQVTGNLFHDNSSQDVFFEMQHGPILVANNLFLSKSSSFGLNSQGIAFAHNLIAGPIYSYHGDTRVTPFQKSHATEFAGLHADSAQDDSGDCRFYNNLFVAPGTLQAMDESALPCFVAGNVFTKGTQPSIYDTNALVESGFNADLKLVQKPDGWYLTINEDPKWRDHVKRQIVTTKLLGKANVSRCAYENRDGSPLQIGMDYFGNRRNKRNPFPGPFEKVAGSPEQIKVWPMP